MARWPAASLFALSLLSSNALADGGENAQLAQLGTLGEQIASYRPCIVEMAREGKTEAAEVLSRIDALSSQAAKAVADRHFSEANETLNEAYQLTVASITRLQAGQTVTSHLAFETPQQEYVYELDRFQSNQILVDMMLNEGRADEAEQRRMVTRHVGDGRKLHDSAGEQAAKGDYRGAVATMEKASMQMNRALQLMGVPSF